MSGALAVGRGDDGDAAVPAFCGEVGVCEGCGVEELFEVALVRDGAEVGDGAVVVDVGGVELGLVALLGLLGAAVEDGATQADGVLGLCERHGGCLCKPHGDRNATRRDDRVWRGREQQVAMLQPHHRQLDSCHPAHQCAAAADFTKAKASSSTSSSSQEDFSTQKEKRARSTEPKKKKKKKRAAGPK